MTFDELEQNIKQYLLLEDRGIVKLLCAAVIANRIPELDPTWINIVSSSSGGKSELLSALSHAAGIVEQDDLTTKALVSGAKNGGKETSLLFRLPPNAIMVIKDLTVLLDKDTKESGQIFSQLRMVYDGKIIKSFGTGEDINAAVRMGLIAGVTSAIEDTNAKQASMGQRTIKYYMKQPTSTEDIINITSKGLSSKRDKEMRKMMGASFKEFLDGNDWDLGAELPELPESVITDISKLSEMATAARSSIKRKEYSRDNPIERKDLRELPYRMAKQLANIARSLIIMNKGALTGLDNRIIYQLALDSIPSMRKDVMIAATKFNQVTREGLALAMNLPEESVKIYLDDLVALDIVKRMKSMAPNGKMLYELREDYRQLISKFENIPMTNELLDDGVDALTGFVAAPELAKTEDLINEIPF